MDLTMNTGIAFVIGIFVGFIICRVIKTVSRETPGPQ